MLLELMMKVQVGTLVGQMAQDIAQQPLRLTAVDRDNVARWALLMLVLVLVLLITLIAMVWVGLVRRRTDRIGVARGRPSIVTDAWGEAGRRMELPAGSPSEKGQAEGVRSGAAKQGTDNADRGGKKVDGQPRSLAGMAGVAEVTGERPVALVTGGAKRVGKAICLELARSGCDILLTYHSSEGEARELVGELKALGVGAVAHQINLLDLDAVELLADYLAGTLPRLDVLVHNASVYAATPLHDLATREAIQQLSVNALAPLILTSRLAPLLRQSKMEGGGAIVALVDIHAMGRPRVDFVAYSMSKAALVELVYSAARSLAPNVRVNGVAPGVVAWPGDGIDSTEAEQAAYLRRVPLGRSGEPQDAAKAVRWLALEATYTTGQIIRVDGGRWIT